MRKHKTRLTILPVNEKQLDIGIEKFVRMIYQVESKLDVMQLKDFTNILIAQLRVHGYHEMADTVLSSYFEELKKYEGIIA